MNSPVLYSGFDRSFIDFRHGIRVGRLDPAQRVTRILKSHLTARHGVEMVCDRWGRGIFWQWICWVPKPNREAKPASSNSNFASAKFFISVDRDEKKFQAGFQIERAPTKPGPDDWAVPVEKDWDWFVLLSALKEKKFQDAVSERLDDGFHVRAGAFSGMREFTKKNWDPAACRRAGLRFSPKEWGGFQLLWEMPQSETKTMTGPEIMEAVAAVFDEVAPVMNMCMYKPCLKV